MEDLPPLGVPPLSVIPPSPEESFTDAWDLDGADLALDNLLSPEIIEEVRLEPTWEVDIISFPSSFSDDPGSRPGVLVVSAGGLVVYWEALRRPPAEAEELAREFERGVQAAAEVLGRHPEGVVVRFPEVGAELEPLLAGEGVVLSVMPFLPGLDEVGASIQAGWGGDFVRLVRASPDSWAGWDLPEPVLADLMAAAAQFHSVEPWEQLWDEDVLEASLPGNRRWYVSVVGSPGEPPGFIMFEDLQDMALSLAAPNLEVVWERVRGRHYFLTFSPRDHLPRPMQREMASAGWAVASPAAYPRISSVNAPGGGMSRRDAEDLSLLLRAVSGLVMEQGDELFEDEWTRWKDPRTGVEFEFQDELPELDWFPGDFGDEDGPQGILHDDPVDPGVFERAVLEFLRDTAPPAQGTQDEDPVQMTLFDDEPAPVPWRAGGARSPGDKEEPWSDPGLPMEPFLNDADRADLRELFAGEGFPSFDDLASTVDGLLDRFNQRPLEELGGLSPDQIDSLLLQEWSHPGGPLVLIRDLPFEEVSRAPILRNARTFLDALVQEDGTKATSAGKLNRAFVRTMLREGQWPERLIRYMEKHRQVVNEGDFFPLHTLRILLDLSGLIRKRKGRFAVTRRGREVLSEELAGELFALLFETQFQQMNLAYLDRIEVEEEVQPGIPSSLYRLRDAAPEWRKPEDLVDSLLLPFVRESIPERRGFSLSAHVLSTRLLNVLVRFGLMDIQETPGESGWQSNYQYRTTSLCGRFLRFDLDPA